MQRVIEWILAVIGAVMCIGGAAAIWIAQAGYDLPGDSLWPMPALVLIEVALLGVVGFLGIALDPQPYASFWGYLVWIASGGLWGLSLIGEMSVSVIVVLAVPALVLGGAAILADRRRKRKMLPDLGILALSCIANYALFFAFILFAK